MYFALYSPRSRSDTSRFRSRRHRQQKYRCARPELGELILRTRAYGVNKIASTGRVEYFSNVERMRDAENQHMRNLRGKTVNVRGWIAVEPPRAA